MPLSNPFRRTADRPSLRERAAALRASFRPAAPVAAPATAASLAPGSADAMAAFHEACRQHSIRTAHLHDCPELMRDGGDVWSTQSLMQALELGEIGADEYARLHSLASERELRFAEITHELSIAPLFALAYASEYPVPPGPKGSGDGDAELLSLVGPWEAATTAYDRAIQNQITVSVDAPTVETPPAQEAYEEWKRLIPDWRERMGVNAAEDASREAMDAVHEIEDRIAALPATTMAGLRLKARLAERSARCEIVWPDGFGEGLVRDILAISEPEAIADADLLRLGRLFEAVRQRTAAACEACNAAGREADRLMPERPSVLTLRESDHPLRIYREITYPTALQGRDLTASDVEWLRQRMPMMHEVLRPIRGGERAHVDHPGRRFEVVPHPEAQDRAEEIITAWDAWRADINRIYREHVTKDLELAADAASEATDALARQIASLPAHTADGFRVKLRALCYYQRETLAGDLPDQPDPDQILSHSLWRDMQGEAKPFERSGASLVPAILDGWAAWGLVGITKDEAAWDKADAQRDRLLYATMALPANSDTIAAKALACAWMEWVNVEHPGQSRDAYSPADQLVFDIHATIMGRQAAPTSTRPLGLLRSVGIDLKALSLGSLAALHSAAELISEVAAAITCQPKSMTGDYFSPSGRMVDHIHNDLCDAIAATEAEIRSRETSDRFESEARLAALAASTIHNDDWDQITALAREMLAHAEAERAKG
jgi:hypothetical protein